ncbi:MAG: GNAT family N-acetyltransferase [Solirubrobacteraceae bacterium]|nr:GNAT family N-acetyltransferase [Solirubrobacteraceae bacterium]
MVALVELAYRGEGSRDGWTSEADLIEGQRTDAAMVAEALDRPGAHILLAHEGEDLIGCCELQRPRRNAELVPAGEVGAEDETSQPLHEERKADDPPKQEHPDGVSEGAAYLGMFSVDPTLQGGGVGKQFLEEAERIARTEWNADAVELTVIDLRTELIEWYGRRGYEQTGRFKDFPYGNERFGIPARDDLRLAVLAKPLS